MKRKAGVSEIVLDDDYIGIDPVAVDHEKIEFEQMLAGVRE
jgi:hypothetical protein